MVLGCVIPRPTREGASSCNLGQASCVHCKCLCSFIDKVGCVNVANCDERVILATCGDYVFFCSAVAVTRNIHLIFSIWDVVFFRLGHVPYIF